MSLISYHLVGEAKVVASFPRHMWAGLMRDVDSPIVGCCNHLRCGELFIAYHKNFQRFSRRGVVVTLFLSQSDNRVY
jgi:hypothetical protein